MPQPRIRQHLVAKVSRFFWLRFRPSTLILRDVMGRNLRKGQKTPYFWGKVVKINKEVNPQGIFRDEVEPWVVGQCGKSHGHSKMSPRQPTGPRGEGLVLNPFSGIFYVSMNCRHTVRISIPWAKIWRDCEEPFYRYGIKIWRGYDNIFNWYGTKFRLGSCGPLQKIFRSV